MENVNFKAAARRAPSLRGRVTFLAATVVVLLSLTLLILVLVLRSSQANLIARSNKHLEAVVRSLAAAYESRSDRSISLKAREGPDAPPDPRLTEIPSLPLPPRPPIVPADAQLTELTSHVLQNETGIEGGYFRLNDPPLVGYAFPTHEGPGDTRVLPARETPIIVNLTTAAVRESHLQKAHFYGPHDMVLFMAAPVCEAKECAGGPVGAAWLMQRIPGAETDRKRAILWSAFGFATVSCVTMMLAFVVLRQVDHGTRAVLDRLARMESDLSADEETFPVGLAEFHRVMNGLNRLGATLRNQFERERELQGKLHQNDRLAAIGQLAAGVAHDLRNPLATIRLRAQMTQRRTNDEGVVQASSVILTEVDRLDATIERLLNFSRPIQLKLIEVDLSALCAAASVRWSARNEAVSIVCEGERAVVVFTDPSRVQQVLDNLIENALHELVEKKIARPVIALACGRNVEKFWVEVRDNAGGFTREALQNALEPFFTTRAKGTGLGLAISHDIVQALGGSIQLSNGKNGAVVRLEFSSQGDV